MKNNELYLKAMEIKKLYNTGCIDRKEAKKQLEEYEEFYNKKAKEIAKKYNQKPSKFSFINFMR